MDKTGLTRPGNWNDAWISVKRVWASKWNERAYLSRVKQRIDHNDLFMAVLIQEVVNADYSYVIHTVNPLSGNRNELYGELVRGLGETLVGNYPGRAYSFLCDKGRYPPRVLAFPSKSIGLFGGELIFRSDSNGEDLPEYAGAGIYESIILPKPKRLLIDYTNDPILWDNPFQMDIMKTILKIGTLVEKCMGSAQDIEGVFSKGRYYIVQTRPQVGTIDE